MRVPLPLTTPGARWSFIAGSVLLAGTLAGCASTSAALTKEELIEQGNAICAAGDDKMSTAMPDWSASEPPSEPTMQAFFGTVTSEVTVMVEGLRGLTPPAELEADYAAMLAEADAALVKMKASDLETFMNQQEDPFAKANEIANRIGLTVCGASD